LRLRRTANMARRIVRPILILIRNRLDQIVDQPSEYACGCAAIAVATLRCIPSFDPYNPPSKRHMGRAMLDVFSQEQWRGIIDSADECEGFLRLGFSMESMGRR
jgi:hypothetical protein